MSNLLAKTEQLKKHRANEEKTVYWQSSNWLSFNHKKIELLKKETYKKYLFAKKYI